MSEAGPRGAPGQGGWSTVRGRLAGRGAVLTAVGIALALLALLGELDVVLAGAAFFGVVLVALFIPHGGAAAVLEQQSVAAESTIRATMESVADALVEPCILVDSRSMVLHANAAAQQEFPATRAGDPIALSIRHPALLNAIDGARRTGEAQITELHQTVPAESWYQVAVKPLQLADSGSPGVLVINMRSRTEEKRIEQMRSDFIANASHELRTPLASLVGFIDTLMGAAANDAAARQRFLPIMRAQAGRMSKLIDDLLSLSRIEMRQHVRPTGKVDVAALLREVREGLAVQAVDAGVAIALDAPDAPAVVTGDRDELYETFENLIDNAIKYGGGGGRVEVKVTPAEHRAGGGYVISVVDFGAGIPPEHVPRLTERFYRVDADSSRRKKGTGLGLAIVKHIVGRHRGTLSIRSTPGQGTRVEVTLPD